jgi:hypothetical protein
VADLDRIAFVTRHYTDLRNGVIRAAFLPAVLAGGFLEGVIAAFGFPHPVRLTLGLLNIFALAAAGCVAAALASRRMDRRFGRVQLNPLYSGPFRGMVLLMAIAILDDFVARPGAGIPPLRFLTMAAYGLWLVVKLRPYGFHNVIPAVIAFLSATTYMNVANETAHDAWVVRAYTATLTAWIVAGLIDLSILSRVLPLRADASAEQHADTI